MAMMVERNGDTATRMGDGVWGGEGGKWEGESDKRSTWNGKGF